jgi:hypothetical protein
VTIAAGAAVSNAVDFSKWAGGSVIMPAAWTAADLGFQISDAEDGTYVVYADRLNQFGTDVSIDGPEASRGYPLPGWVFDTHWVKLFSHDGSGTGENQDAERTLTLLLKS